MEIISNMVSSDKEDNEGVNLDKILVEEIGQFGKYQLKVILFCAVVHLFTGFSECEYLYTAANVNYRCTIPECENEELFSPSWLLNAIPSLGDTFDSCRRFANSSVSRNVTMDFTCPQHMFDRGKIIDCEGYIYEHQNSAVYEFDLACNEWRRALVGFASVLGTMLGLPITGFFSDRYGRRITMSISSFNYAWIGVVKYWANSYETLIVGIFVEHLLGACSFTCAFILAIELVGSKRRAAVGSLMSTCLALGTTLQGLVTWTQPYWRHFILIVNVPQLVAIFYFWASPESVRWLISKGRFEEAKSALMVVAETNGRKLSENTLESFKEEENNTSKHTATESDSWLISLVFQHNSMILRCLVTPVWWISALLIYFGLTITSFVLFGGMAFLSGLLVILAPETLGTTLPNTMEEAANFV